MIFTTHFSDMYCVSVRSVWRSGNSLPTIGTGAIIVVVIVVVTVVSYVSIVGTVLVVAIAGTLYWNQTCNNGCTMQSVLELNTILG